MALCIYCATSSITTAIASALRCAMHAACSPFFDCDSTVSTKRPKPTIIKAIDQFPQDVLAGIGEIVARWGYLHFQLGVIVREVCKLPSDIGRVLTLGPELGVLCNMISTLTSSDHWIKDAGIRADLKKLGGDVRDASKHRNNYAHGVFGLGSKPGTYIRFLVASNEHRISPGEEEITPASLKAIALQADQLWDRAQDITHRLKALRGKRP
jgi:hypothetical protein